MIEIDVARAHVDTLRLIQTLSPETVQTIVNHLNKHVAPRLTQDVSNYAKGRDRVWLWREWDLLTKTFKPALQDERITSWIRRQFGDHWDVGLITRGPVGIDLHRDDSYADWKGLGINLGECGAWLYQEGYRDFKWQQHQAKNPVMEFTLPVGSVIEFNTKNRHGVRDIAPDRWAINLWHSKVG